MVFLVQVNVFIYQFNYDNEKGIHIFRKFTAAGYDKNVYINNIYIASI